MNKIKIKFFERLTKEEQSRLIAKANATLENDDIPKEEKSNCSIHKRTFQPIKKSALALTPKRK